MTPWYWICSLEVTTRIQHLARYTMFILLLCLSFRVLIMFSSEVLLMVLAGFLLVVLLSISLLSNWVRYILVLVYLGGLFVLVTYIVRYSFVLSLSRRAVTFIILLTIFPILTEKEPVFTRFLEQSYVWLSVLLVILLIALSVVSILLPGSKSIRRVV